MYSVLIFNKKTAESFNQFRPLFADAIREGEIGVCEWTDSEFEKIEIALPRLYNMVGDKKEWRAIVIQSYLGKEDGDYAVDPRNPFDYIVNRNEYYRAVEIAKKQSAQHCNLQVEVNINQDKPSNIPLVVLSQMLLGVPKVTPRFYDVKYSYLSDVEERNILSSLNLEDAYRSLLRKKQDLEKSIYDIERELEEAFETSKRSKKIVLGSQSYASLAEAKNIVKADMKSQIDSICAALDFLEKEKEQRKKELDNYSKLERKYRFHANRPKEMLFVAVRPKQIDDLNRLKDAWANYDEIQSSKFWEYNHYSERTRFIAYDIEQKGEIQAQGDMLKLWLAIGLLASNHLDPSSFRSSVLHSMSIRLDNQKMADSFHDMAYQLTAAREYLKRSMAQDKERFVNEQIDPPDYNVSVSVNIDDTRLTEPGTSYSRFGLVSSGNDKDVAYWKQNCKEYDSFIRRLRRMIGRAVEDSAQRMRGNCEFEPEEVDPMTDFQAKEFSGQLSDSYQKVLDDQALLKLGEEVKLVHDKEKKEEEVLSILMERMNIDRVLLGYRIVLVFTLVAIVPAVIRAYTVSTSVFIPVFGSIAFSSAIYLIATFFVCKRDWYVLIMKIAEYMNVFTQLKQLMRSNAAAYAEFLSSVGSHMKGSSYLNILHHKEYRCEDITQQKKHHLDEIGKFKRLLEEWARSVYVPCNLELSDKDIEIEFDDMDIPNFYSLYTLEFGQSYQIPFNNSGKLTSRYSFITGLDVVREDLYDDNIFGGNSDIDNI